MLVYDVTSEKTFDNIRNWIRNIEEVGLAGFLMHKLVNDGCQTSYTCDCVFPNTK